MNEISNNYWNAISEVAFHTAGQAVDVLITEIAAKALSNGNPALLAILIGRDLIYMGTGVSESIEQKFQMVAYYEAGIAVKKLLNPILTRTENDFYYVIDEEYVSDFTRFIMHLAQIRLLGEKKWGEYASQQDFVRWIYNLFTNPNYEQEIADSVQSHVDLIKNNTEKIAIILSSNLL